MEEPENHSNEITMILYIFDNDKKNPSQNWEIIPKKKVYNRSFKKRRRFIFKFKTIITKTC